MQNSRGPEGRNVWEDARVTSGPEATGPGTGSKWKQQARQGVWLEKKQTQATAAQLDRLTSALLGFAFSKLLQSYTNSQGGHGTQEIQPLALTPPEREAEGGVSGAKPFPNTHYWGCPGQATVHGNCPWQLHLPN